MQATEVEILQAKIEDLQKALKQGDKDIAGTFKLSPKLANLLGLLMSLPVVTTEMVEHRLELATQVRVTVHRLRKQLKSFGIEIKSCRTVGYWLEPAAKDSVKNYMALVVEEPVVAVH